MMSFEEFAENVVKEIRAKVGGAFQIKEHNVIKNNNVKRAGIAVMKNEEDIGPCVYLDAFYREYESDGMKFDEHLPVSELLYNTASLVLLISCVYFCPFSSSLNFKYS